MLLDMLGRDWTVFRYLKWAYNDLSKIAFPRDNLNVILVKEKLFWEHTDSKIFLFIFKHVLSLGTVHQFNFFKSRIIAVTMVGR